MADKPRESPVIKPEDFEYEPEVVDWSRLLERDIPEEELPVIPIPVHLQSALRSA